MADDSASARPRPAAVALVLLLLAAAVGGPSADETGWETALGDLRSRRDRLLATLTRARAALEPRARERRPDLLARLALDPEPLPAGYGILPPLDEDAPLGPVVAREAFYSLERLERRFDAADEDAGKLLADATGAGTPPLEPLATEFRRLADELRNLEQHLSYHDYWQRSVAEDPEFYAGRNRLVALARELAGLADDRAQAARAEELRAEIVAQVAPFRKTAGLALERRANGSLRLPVTVCTDIVDRRFLRAFRRGVRDAYDGSAAARARRFGIDLDFRRLAPTRLYPEGAPARGSEVDLRGHRARFAGCPLVLTTGARSTHALLGDGILLGPARFTPRALAHEFGHLLGFGDAYVRGYDGDPTGPYGASIVEWTGITDDLMGNPGHGRVTEAMIDRLIRAYGPPR